MEDVRDNFFISTRLVGRNCLVAEKENPNFATKQFYIMTDQKNQYTRKQGRSGQQPLDFSLAHVMPQAPDMEKAVLVPSNRMWIW